VIVKEAVFVAKVTIQVKPDDQSLIVDARGYRVGRAWRSMAV